MDKRSYFTDIIAVIFLLLFVTLFAIVFVDFSLVPMEDAAILMRYAEHFAQGYGIVWNIGDKPVDGATDFLFMVLVGLLVKAGLSLEFATRFLPFTSHILTVVIVYLSLRKLFQADLVSTLVSSLYLAVGPGLYYVAAYFGTPFFVLFVSITWWMALMIIKNGATRRNSFLFAMLALVTALIRPEGLILSALMLLSIVYLNGLRKSRLTILYYLGIILFIGGIYFLWRWQYFGYPLPNTFYKKGGGKIYIYGLIASIRNTIVLCLPFLPAYILGLYSPKMRKLTRGFSIPILGFMSAFILLSSQMNFKGRLQYALLPIVLMSWLPLLAGIKDDLRFPKWNTLNLQKRAMSVLFVLTLSLGVVAYQYKVGEHARYFGDGRYGVAFLLRDYCKKGYTIATTEAGLLPLYSRWKAIDTWGLNDQWITHNGRITEEYLDRFKPQVIMFHDYFSALTSPNDRTGEWFEMVMTLKKYAQSNGYSLAAVFGDSPYDTHYYYVRTDFAESAEIISRIRSIDYYWYESGREAINYVSLTSEQK